MAVWLEMQCVLGGVGESVKRRMAHVLLKMVLLVADHGRSRQMAEAWIILMHAGGEHGC